MKSAICTILLMRSRSSRSNLPHPQIALEGGAERSSGHGGLKLVRRESSKQKPGHLGALPADFASDAGPALLYERHDGNAMVISPLNNFMTASSNYSEAR